MIPTPALNQLYLAKSLDHLMVDYIPIGGNKHKLQNGEKMVDMSETIVIIATILNNNLIAILKSYQLRDVSLFSGGGEDYQFFKQGSQKILTLPLNTNKKILTLPQP